MAVAMSDGRRRDWVPATPKMLWEVVARKYEYLFFMDSELAWCQTMAADGTVCAEMEFRPFILPLLPHWLPSVKTPSQALWFDFWMDERRQELTDEWALEHADEEEPMHAERMEAHASTDFALDDVRQCDENFCSGPLFSFVYGVDDDADDDADDDVDDGDIVDAVLCDCDLTEPPCPPDPPALTLLSNCHPPFLTILNPLFLCSDVDDVDDDVRDSDPIEPEPPPSDPPPDPNPSLFCNCHFPLNPPLPEPPPVFPPPDPHLCVLRPRDDDVLLMRFDDYPTPDPDPELPGYSNPLGVLSLPPPLAHVSSPACSPKPECRSICWLCSALPPSSFPSKFLAVCAPTPDNTMCCHCHSEDPLEISVSTSFGGQLSKTLQVLLPPSLGSPASSLSVVSDLGLFVPATLSSSFSPTRLSPKFYQASLAPGSASFNSRPSYTLRAPSPGASCTTCRSVVKPEFLSGLPRSTLAFGTLQPQVFLDPAPYLHLHPQRCSRSPPAA